jgi:predicted alpha/beta superfamily hydrolase
MRRGHLLTLIAGVTVAAFLTLTGGGSPVGRLARADPAPLAPNTDRFVMHSARAGRDYLIEVTPPARPIPPGRKLPVVYLLDAGYHVAAPEAWALQTDGVMAPAFVVAIGYPPDAPNARETDLLYRPLPDQGASAGGGGGFEGFILDVLRPAIETRYPVDPNRSILLGHSLAGLFVANLLADRPRAFSAYLMASPSIWADGETLARVRAAAPKGQGRRVFLAVGGAETQRMLKGVDALHTVLGRPPSTFVVHMRMFAGQVHRSYYPAFVEAALTDVLPGAVAK